MAQQAPVSHVVNAIPKDGKVFPPAWKTDHYIHHQTTDPSALQQQQQQQHQSFSPYYAASTAAAAAAAAAAVASTNNTNAGFRVRQHAPPPYLQQQQQQQYHMPSQPPPPHPQGNTHSGQYYYPNYSHGYLQQNIMDPQPQPQQQQHSINRPVRKRRRPPHSYASLIAQAILTSPEQRLTLREIYEWIQTRYPNLYEANETGWQNTIRHNLSLNRCFMKLPRTQHDGSRNKGSKGGYWAVDIDKLSHTNFGRQIIDSGFLGNLEYWQQQQTLEEQRQRQRSSYKSFEMPVALSQQPVDDFDFDNLVAPPTGSIDQQDRMYTADESDRSFLTRIKRPLSALSSTFNTNTTKTSSVRDSMSPGSTTSSSMSTPMLPSSQSANSTTANNNNALKFELSHHHPNDNPLMNPSLMRVNNIIN